MLLIGLADWGLGQLTVQLWLSLSRSTFWLVEQLLQLLTPDVVCNPDRLIMGTSSFVRGPHYSRALGLRGHRTGVRLRWRPSAELPRRTAVPRGPVAAAGSTVTNWLTGRLAGAAFALSLYLRGRLADVVHAHAVTNALLAGYILLTGAWWMW